MITEISFLICAITTIALSIFMITRKQPVTAAITLVVIMMLLAGMYGLSGAHFSAVAQIIVYAGAIMVVFVFVIMLLNLPPNLIAYGRVTIVEMFLILCGIFTAVFFGTQVGKGFLSKIFVGAANEMPQQYFEQTENVKNVSALMFTDYLWPFELVSFLILVAVIGAVVIAKKEKRLTSDDHTSS